MAINTSAFEASLQAKLDATNDAKEMLLLGKALESTVGSIAVSDVNTAGATQVAAVGTAATAKIAEVAAAGAAQVTIVTNTTSTHATAAAASATAAAASEAGAASAATTAVNAVISTAPANLDTLNELAAALGNDANYAATTTAALASKAPQSTTYTKTETDAKIVALSPPATKAHIESLGIAASSITGALPAIDGSALTGIASTPFFSNINTTKIITSTIGHTAITIVDLTGLVLDQTKYKYFMRCKTALHIDNPNNGADLAVSYRVNQGSWVEIARMRHRFYFTDDNRYGDIGVDVILPTAATGNIELRFTGGNYTSGQVHFNYDSGGYGYGSITLTGELR